MYLTEMKYLAAYLLLVNAGNTAPSAADVKKVLESVSIEVEDDKVEKLLAEVEGKNVEELIAEGNEKLSSVPSGAPAAAGAAAASGSTEAAAEEPQEEEKEESDDDMGFGLFD
ncbi:putative ribosomal protein [Clavispora lusitaniae]|uniref:Ribosomal protein n=2 Tax=Clavispora lusitaniae TaxID=36911 RepID=A0AA91PZ48_CLALS|nr:putative ribosomal protein [Clavispora lusitaniae]